MISVDQLRKQVVGRCEDRIKSGEKRVMPSTLPRMKAYSYFLFKGRQGRTPLRFRYFICFLWPWELRRNGSFVDYEKRVQGTVDCTFCTECWSKIMTFSGEDEDNLKAAIERRRKDFGDV